MSHLEIEYKTLLTKDEFRRLEQRFQHVSPITQTNYYFDTPDFQMKANRLSLRIRTFADRGELTLKIPETIGNLEINLPLSLTEAKAISKSAQIPPGQIQDMIKDRGIDCQELEVLGHLTTTRREMTTPIGLMALDYNLYAGIKDYELEVEVTDPVQGKVDFEQFLIDHQIDFKYAKSKVARFTNTLRNS